MIVSGPDLPTAVLAVQAALARGGVATTDLADVLVPAQAPAASAQVLPEETLNLALEAYQLAGSTMTLADLGKMLQDFGWKFQSDTSPGEQLASLLKQWLVGAQKDPADPLNFAVLFMAEMAKHRTPPVDLAMGDTAPDKVHLTLLELEIFSAAFDRFVSNLPHAGLIPPDLASGSAHLAAPLAQDGFCTKVKELVKSPYNTVANEMGNKQLRDQLGTVAESELQGKGMEVVAGEGFGDAMSAVSIATRLWKLVALYSSDRIWVTASKDKVHKPLKENSEFVVFTARAGVSEADWQAYQDKWGGKYGVGMKNDLRDCVANLGVPTPADLSEIAKDAETWRVAWVVNPVGFPHATINLAGTHAAPNENSFQWPGQMMNPLKRSSPSSHSAETTFVLTINTEEENVHKAGKLTSASVDVCGNLKTDQPPSLSTFVNAAKGGLGLIDSMVELGAGWIQNMWTPSSCATLVVEYEEVVDWKIDETIVAGQVTGHYTALSCGSPYGPWEIKEEGTFPTGTTTGGFKIPFSADGKSPVTYESHLRAAGEIGADISGSTTVSIIPMGANYQMKFANFTTKGTCWGAGVKAACNESPINNLIFKIVPAGPGECKK
jgi:hypothetical protein